MKTALFFRGSFLSYKTIKILNAIIGRIDEANTNLKTVKGLFYMYIFRITTKQYVFVKVMKQTGCFFVFFS